jgi:hypothetical protein
LLDEKRLSAQWNQTVPGTRLIYVNGNSCSGEENAMRKNLPILVISGDVEESHSRETNSDED